jgi:hypothetical protein
VQTLLLAFAGRMAQLTCSHQYIRARFDDGSYGLRCMHCLKQYAHTWDEVVNQPDNPAVVRSRERFIPLLARADQ